MKEKTWYQAGEPMPQPAGDNEYVVISDQGVGVGRLDGNTIHMQGRIRPPLGAANVDVLRQHYPNAASGAGFVVQLLADLRHWCDANGYQDFGRLDKQAYEQYLQER